MYCQNCGKEISERVLFCPHCGTQREPIVVYCTRCGAPIPEGKNVCEACGTPVRPVQEEAYQPDYVQPEYNQPYQQTYSPAGYEQKSRIVAGILGILLGSLGIHNFYLGYTGRGIAQLLISLCSCFTLSVVSGIWGLIEGIMLLTQQGQVDAKGVPLKD